MWFGSEFLLAEQQEEGHLHWGCVGEFLSGNLRALLIRFCVIIMSSYTLSCSYKTGNRQSKCWWCHLSFLFKLRFHFPSTLPLSTKSNQKMKDEVRLEAEHRLHLLLHLHYWLNEWINSQFVPCHWWLLSGKRGEKIQFPLQVPQLFPKIKVDRIRNDKQFVLMSTNCTLAYILQSRCRKWFPVNMKTFLV